MAGIASVQALRESPSHTIRDRIGTTVDAGGAGLEPARLALPSWPAEAGSVVVLGLVHAAGEPELDWWGVDGSPGDRALGRFCQELSGWIEEELGIRAQGLAYSVDRGGVYLKDAAVLAGLGCVGRNNLLVTPQLGPRVRLRAVLLYGEVAPTGPVAFDPCAGCEGMCGKACPQSAFDEVAVSSRAGTATSLPARDGCFSRARCAVQMDQDVAAAAAVTAAVAFTADGTPAPDVRIHYCRQCELACPVGEFRV